MFAGRWNHLFNFRCFEELCRHCKKGYWFLRLQPGWHSNSPRRGIIILFPARESLFSDIPAGVRKTANLFLQCIISPRIVNVVFNGKKDWPWSFAGGGTGRTSPATWPILKITEKIDDWGAMSSLFLHFQGWLVFVDPPFDYIYTE